MMRIALFLGTNLAILMLISITFRLLGIEGLLLENGVDLNLNALLVYSAVIGFSGSLISLFISKWMAKRSMGVEVIETPGNEAEQWLVNTIERQAQQAKIGMPEVGIFDHASPNAFATGWNKNSALVAVSTGLLQQMNRDEVEAVLGHEVSHVANGDMVTLSLIQGVVNTFVVFLSRVIGHTVDRIVFKTERGYGPAFFIVSMIAEFVLGILAMTIVMWFSRWREFRADRGGAELAGREKMIAALRRLQQAHEPESLPDEIAALAISAGKVQKLFASHPPLESRIRALQSE
ncbi:MAG: protease HtpX [Candidatus Thiodiazotropha sp. (ex Lucina aurantia)]|uniref:Protease HtpX n=1 Tax=Candidatus Thiodiazotropha endolucinida TaxID=1655433 RepID=A0A7Z0VI32_9GAMM|nr:protease HtpX [Candidatus Thiodiazotropha endolucinida]MBT3014099.1 protease HtpX [Candidatus Thiodiazotropha sp. (ex Lucina pensylvanica)]MBT3024534.1 protease HtpX [Candidatus Thiodiazotropha taylori]MBT3056850.1 protease HtpX [Candidatus Thiodiazotropha sp. (ex Codakia orbicularis)]MBV2104279.1 protease HtpX [Candidatus Thiodiazotropha sp. (ex Lucina aurantia)]MBV2101365.1 protease HtpX [Candidatus Thiodiazotropha sp. (ex Codakia orbicularis)]